MGSSPALDQNFFVQIFFRLCETFFRKYLQRVHPSFFCLFCKKNWMFKDSQSAPFYMFRHYATYRKPKNSKKKIKKVVKVIVLQFMPQAFHFYLKYAITFSPSNGFNSRTWIVRPNSLDPLAKLLIGTFFADDQTSLGQTLLMGNLLLMNCRTWLLLETKYWTVPPLLILTPNDKLRKPNGGGFEAR